jgi:beta-glucanase (GH16 family)
VVARFVPPSAFRDASAFCPAFSSVVRQGLDWRGNFDNTAIGPHRVFCHPMSAASRVQSYHPPETRMPALPHASVTLQVLVRLLLPVALVVLALPDAASIAQPRSSWRLVWADEFDRPGLPDVSRWSYDVGGHGWGNNELQFYTRGRLENARVEDGRLIIEARREAWEGRRYTSARLVTKDKGDWTYGRIAVRARLPRGRGSWPAIWTLGSTTPLEWPEDGEIDIMEHVGFDPGVVHASVHTQRFNHVAGTQKTATIPAPDAASVFHEYVAEWDRHRIRVLLDDREYFVFTREPGGRDVWPFDAPQHLLLNVAVGGNWGGRKGVDEGALPFRLEVDYVRVYAGPGPDAAGLGPDAIVGYHRASRPFALPPCPRC